MEPTALQTATARLKLDVRSSPYRVKIADGIFLGYRRCDGDGSWTARIFNGKGKERTEWLGTADDTYEANNSDVLSFWQAQDKAREEAGRSVSKGTLTVTQAINDYAADLARRGGDSRNVSRLRHHLTNSLADVEVADLNDRQLEKWRDSLQLAKATANRTIRILTAVLNRAAERNGHIGNIRAWKIGLKQFKKAERARNVVISDKQVRELVIAAYAHNESFGLLVAVHAETGARSSQIARLEIADLQAERSRLMVPVSNKGKVDHEKTKTHTAVPISADLTARLRLAAGDRGPSEALL